jgi:hypothetical protein|tara:strand:+ start:107 stop:772 length:666 start_codon:yes stop_codon:yes gene_type:complete
MNRSIKIGVTGLGLLGLTACGATNISNLEDAPPFGATALYKYNVQANKEQVDKIPDWFLKMPKEEASIFAVGTSATPDLQLSVDMAILMAKTTLADRFQSQLRSQTKNFIAKVGTTAVDTTVINELERVTKNLVADTDVSGYSVVENVVQSAGNQFRAYVLLKYNDEEASKVLMNRLKKDRMLMAKLRSNTAFKELDKNVAAAKKEAKSEQEAVVKSYTLQ